MASVSWVKCSDGTSWCPFEKVGLAGVTAQGVYVIWHEGQPGRTVRVGQGDIAARLTAHRSDQQILAYRQYGTLMVTWAEVPAQSRGGIERYLANHYKPLVGEAWPDVTPILVNLPGAA